MTTNTIKISRELKLALTGLALVGAVGGWYTWSATRIPEPAVTAAQPAASGPPATGEGTPAQSGTVTRRAAAIEVQQIPFLTTEVMATDEADSNAASRVFTGGEPALNPFRPLRDPALNAQLPATDGPAAIPAPAFVAANEGTAPAPTPRVPTAVVPPIGRPVPLPSANISAAPFPAAATPVTVTPATPQPAASPVAPVAITPAEPPRAPVKPPVPTLNVPRSAALPVPSVPAASTAPLPRTPGQTPGQAPGQTFVPPLIAQATTPAPAPVAPAPAQPLVQAPAEPLVKPPAEPVEPAPAPVEPAPAPIDPLDAFVADHELRYAAVVLGPVNTAIFQSKKGYQVVSIGQRLPGSDIVVKDIGTTAVTLALGESLKTLELDNR